MDAAQASTGTARLAWLDALRGLAALAVAFHHATYHYTPGLRRQITAWFDPGTFGVVVFFLVSGYIIPASLERSRSLGRFWISRAFRIYPLLLVALAAIALINLTRLWPARDGLAELNPWTVVSAHLTMLQDVLAVPNALNVLWTLSYEMLFYLMVAALFAVGLHRRSAGIATALAAAGGAAIAFGGLLPAGALAAAAGVGPVVAVTALTLAVAIGCVFSRRPAVRSCGAVLGGLLALVLLVGNSRLPVWEGLALLAVMFTGTAAHRAEHGQIKVRTAALCGAVVFTVTTAAGLWHMGGWGVPADELLGYRRAWASSLALAALVFLAGLALRRRPMPRPLTGLGVISYSVYLLHPVLLVLSDALLGRPGEDSPLHLAALLTVLVAASALTQRLVERPGQRLGRRLARRLAPPPAAKAPQTREPEPLPASAGRP
ncbi:acyltransferase family protein [Thermomonospora curvata]|uniref:Acyltransferase 3 n=1 Tax=Thermomonospora curvata (strain ATCC 19995 / DSM 43183 / JCM 3096 / KCTC 9072 / NBRC 15933 / NCIMB 10081 / Henssen B9) TaxID=471852 RepID=D1A1T1_THECD|nr:acyltransferase [Thermomonospora curvata]ACY97769.1 acyltransferase 3 [Thermomonospora curvata DSM 43183]